MEARENAVQVVTVERGEVALDQLLLRGLRHVCSSASYLLSCCDLPANYPVATTLEMQKRPVRVETEADLADRFHAALADIRVLGYYVDVAKMALERLVVPNAGRTGDRVNQVDGLGRRDRHVARRELQARLAGQVEGPPVQRGLPGGVEGLV